MKRHLLLHNDTYSYSRNKVSLLTETVNFLDDRIGTKSGYAFLIYDFLQSL